MEPWLVLFGTFLPLLGVVATAVLATVTRGPWRWSVLFLLPIAVFAACWLSVSGVWFDGNLLAAVFFLAYYVGLLIYYPALIVTWLILRVRQRRRKPEPKWRSNAVTPPV